MSKKILRMPVKASCVDADIITIVDSADSNIHTMNKQATIGSLNKANVQISGAYSTVNPTVPITSDNSNRVRKYTSPLSSLTLNGNPTSDTYEQEFRFTTGATFTFTASGLVGKWIGGTPTFEPNKTYVIAIKNGLAAWGEVS